MINQALKILLKVNNWQTFLDELDNLGSDPKFKKIKGEAFEQLTKYFFLTDPVFISMFTEVWHHSEIPVYVQDKLNLPSPEVGVDLIALQSDGSYCAIQCKFHQDENNNVSYDELSTFFSVTERKETYTNLSHRIISTSAYKISHKVTKLHREKIGIICASDFQSLDELAFEKIHNLIKGEAHEFVLHKPREHQARAIEKCYEYFVKLKKTRGKIIHPCGSGKSLTAYWIAKKINANSVIIAVPSLALVKQTLNTWAREELANGSKMEWIAVCSDQDVNVKEDPAFSTFDLGITVTTDANKVKDFLNSSSEKMKVIITTYQSGNVVANAVENTNYKFNFGIFDEAHKTAGHKSKKFSLLLSDDVIAIEKKLFMTATEREFKGDSSNFLSMDNESIYGEIIDQLSFKKALEITPPILCDYNIITVAVSQREIEQIISNNDLLKINGENYKFEEVSSTIASLITLRRLVVDKNINHAISFHSSIERAKNFRDMSNLVNFADNMITLNAFHVSGRNSAGERNAEINRFLNFAPSVITNSRCLTEGVDIPEIDAVIFSDPKQSVIDIVQAAGRAMRMHENKKIGYIVVPVVIGNSEKDILSETFKQLITVIAALGINDERIIDEVKQYVSSALKKSDGILQFMEYSSSLEVDFKNLVDGLQIKLWDRLSFAKSVIGESNFAKWMRDHTNLAEKTIKNYSQAIRKISNDLVKLNLAFSTLEEISEKSDLKKLKDHYFAIDEFKQLNVRGKGMYSAGFNRLIEYQDFLKKQMHKEK